MYPSLLLPLSRLSSHATVALESSPHDWLELGVVQHNSTLQHGSTNKILPLLLVVSRDNLELDGDGPRP